MWYTDCRFPPIVFLKRLERKVQKHLEESRSNFPCLTDSDPHIPRPGYPFPASHRGRLQQAAAAPAQQPPPTMHSGICGRETVLPLVLSLLVVVE